MSKWETLDTTDKDEQTKMDKSKRLKKIYCILSIIVSLVVLITWSITRNLYYDSGEEQDIPITARIIGHGHYKKYHCDDMGFDCCYIYTQDKQYKIDPRYVVASDKESSNCPTFVEIINKYKQYIHKYEREDNCTNTQCCKLDVTYDLQKRYNDHINNTIIDINKHICPNIYHMIYLHTHGYPDPDLDFELLLGFIVFTLFVWLCTNR